MISNNIVYNSNNLHILRGLPSNAVDLIYLDPPFNSNREYLATRGSSSEKTGFSDIWTWEDVDLNHFDIIGRDFSLLKDLVKIIFSTRGKAMAAYAAFMAQRLVEMRRVLTPTGSIYLHCDTTASHYLKMLLDAIFGHTNFLNEIVWQRTSAHSNARRCGAIHDVIFLYKKGGKCLWNGGKQQYSEHYIQSAYTMKDKKGRFCVGDLTAPSSSKNRDYAWKGVKVGRNRGWVYSEEKMEELDQQGLIYYTKNGKPGFKRYLDRKKGIALQDIWCDIPPVSANAHERTGYPTQKPLKLLNRIIKASSNEGDIVLDPFCGSGTTLEAAHRLKRKWIGIELNGAKTAELLQSRLGEKGSPFTDFVFTDNIPDKHNTI